LIGPTRRQVLGWALAVPGLGCQRKGPAAGSGAAPPAATAPPEAAARLGPAAYSALAAAVDRILPGEGGSREAGAIAFIDAQLGSRLLAPALPLFQQAGRMLDAYARRRHGADFAALQADQKDAILEELAHGRIPVKAFPQKEFFVLLHTLTLEGTLSDPVHGGNQGGVGWAAVGFVAPPLRHPAGGKHGG